MKLLKKFYLISQEVNML